MDTLLVDRLRSRATDSVNLRAAFSLWSGWTLDIPPSGSTGDETLDKRLADAFRALLALETQDERFTWIERHVFAGNNDFPPPDRPRDRYRETMIEWWLQLFETE